MQRRYSFPCPSLDSVTLLQIPSLMHCYWTSLESDKENFQIKKKSCDAKAINIYVDISVFQD